MKDRIPLQIIEGRLVLIAVIECLSLRIHKQIMRFVIDTGSPDSYMSQKDIIKLQIAVKGRNSEGEVDFGGSRFKRIKLPTITIYLLKEGKQDKDYLAFDIALSALSTTKTSEKKVRIAEELPSVLGIDFLEQQKLSLHVILREKIAYLEYEG